MKQITFTYEDKEYILEFNRDTAKEAGVPTKELQDLENEPMKALDLIPQIWCAAFEMHNPSCPQETRMAIYEAMEGKDEELVTALIGIYMHPLETLFAKEGNVKWKKNWEDPKPEKVEE